jgi:histone H3/H4
MENIEEIEKKSKRVSHHFEKYIVKVLKQILETNEKIKITMNSRKQINSVLMILCKEIYKKINELMIISNRKIITKKEIINSIKLILSGQLLENCIKEGNIYIDNVDKLIFPVFISEKMLKSFGTGDKSKKIYYMVSKEASIFLSGVLEYITSEILDLASNYCKSNKHICITVKDINFGVTTDSEFSHLFNKLNINFLNCGSIPFIHNFIISKSTVSTIENIKSAQKNNGKLQISLSTFKRHVKQLFNIKNNGSIKISKDFFSIFQYFIENYAVQILKDANFLVIYSNRLKVTGVDIELANIFKNNLKNPYNSFNENNNFIFDIDLLPSSFYNSEIDDVEDIDEYDAEMIDGDTNIGDRNIAESVVF